jgi:3'(2'), 5'-bisphosphate nucleotidase
MKKRLAVAIDAALEAGKAVLEVYQSDFAVTQKDDKSPLTLADRRSHEIIMASLEKMPHPILSEEGRSIPYAERRLWNTFWLVDPLDGTKEFIKRNGEFTVNIALVEKQQPVMGVIYVPVTDTLYFGEAALGAYRMDKASTTCASDARPSLELEAYIAHLIRSASRLPIAPDHKRPYTIVGSRSHSTPEVDRIVEENKRIHGTVDFISAGSSLKICMVAEGRADLYPRTGPTMEWDTGAGQAIARSAGADVIAFHSTIPLQYNKENLLNPWFTVRWP